MNYTYVPYFQTSLGIFNSIILQDRVLELPPGFPNNNWFFRRSFEKTQSHRPDSIAIFIDSFMTKCLP